MASETRNLILAIALSILVFIGWTYFFAPTHTPAPATATTAASTTTGTPAAPSAPATPAGPAAPVDRGEALATAPRVPIATAKVSGSINLRGARIDDVRLNDYRETVDPTSPIIVLLSPSGTADPFYAEYGFVTDAGAKVTLPTANTVWTAAPDAKLTIETPLTLTYDNGAGLVFTRVISIDQNYMFSVKDTVANTSGDAVTLYPYGLISRHGLPHTAGYYVLHEGMIGVWGEAGLKEEKYSALQKEGQMNGPKSTEGWLGITDKYWAATLVPTPGTTFTPRFVHTPANGAQKERFQAEYLGDALTIAPGASGEVAAKLFAGAKVVSIINAYQNDLHIDRFDRLIDWGWFYFLTRPMFFLIDWLYHLVGNFGVAILLVTVLVKAVFFPLANKSYESMSRMKKVQPELVALRERFPDDRMKQQQAMMELYKKEKINPLSGCLPIVVQIPVFFALYKVLFVTIEMRHAPFIWWIRDLSAPDPTTIFNLFGLIPWTPPHMLMIGLLPILMGISQWVQMKMNPAPTDETQAMIFNWMPVIFTFMLASFPAGLVLYWTWNNTLSVLQQGIIMRKNGVPIELWGNLSKTFKRKPKAIGKPTDKKN
ncbi:membrane protein insertase YidC [Segnochrobactraceae bacterium EtOH-i3]